LKREKRKSVLVRGCNRREKVKGRVKLEVGRPGSAPLGKEEKTEDCGRDPDTL